VAKNERLTDHRIEQERWARDRRDRRQVAYAFGYFIAHLTAWDWFVNPLTLRDRGPAAEAGERGELLREGRFAICKPDPRLGAYEPTSRYSPPDGPLPPIAALGAIQGWLLGLQRQAGHPIGWMIAEEFGRLGGRWHCHALLTGVSCLDRKQAWITAGSRFGFTNVVPFDPHRGAAFYAAKYAGRWPGRIHFGGTLAGTDLSECEKSRSQGGGRDVALSAPLPKGLFHMCLPRRHR
jgi:hypothetical protein